MGSGSGMIVGLLKNNTLSAFRIFIPLLSLPVLSRALTKVDLGNYAAAISISAWVFLICEYGLSVTATRKMGKALTFPVQLYWDSIFVKATIGILVSVIGIALSLTTKLSPTIIFLGWSIGFLQSFTPNWVFISNNEYFKIILADIVVQSAMLLIGLSVLVLHCSNWIVYTSLYVLIIFVQIFILNLTVIKKYGVKYKSSRLLSITSIIKGGANIFLNRFVSSLYTALGGFSVYAIAGATAAANFSNTDRLTKVVNSVNDVSVNSLLGRATKTFVNGEDIRPIVRRLLVFLLVVNCMFLLVLDLNARTIVSVIFGDSYAGMEKYVKIYSLVLIPIAYTYTIGILWLNSISQEKYFTMSILITLLVLFGPTIYFLKTIGLMGYIYGIVAIEYTNAAILTVILLKKSIYPFQKRRVNT